MNCIKVELLLILHEQNKKAAWNEFIQKCDVTSTQLCHIPLAFISS